MNKPFHVYFNAGPRDESLMSQHSTLESAEKYLDIMGIKERVAHKIDNLQLSDLVLTGFDSDMNEWSIEYFG
jgi:hypothetical protein